MLIVFPHLNILSVSILVKIINQRPGDLLQRVNIANKPQLVRVSHENWCNHVTCLQTILEFKVQTISVMSTVKVNSPRWDMIIIIKLMYSALIWSTYLPGAGDGGMMRRLPVRIIRSSPAETNKTVATPESY